jgi:hypothetical protein
MLSGLGCVGDVLVAAVGWLVDGSLIPQGPVDHRPRGSDPYPPNSGLNVESNIETPPEILVEGYPVTTCLTTSYLSRGARIRTGDLLLPKLFAGTPIFAKIA